MSSKEIKGDHEFVSIIMVTYNSVNKLHEFFDEVLKSLINLDYDNYAVLLNILGIFIVLILYGALRFRFFLKMPIKSLKVLVVISFGFC